MTTHQPRAASAEHAARGCDAALTVAFGLLGKRWNGMLLGTLTDGPASFTQLRVAVAGISDSVLADRLAALGEAGLVQRTVDPGPPVGVRYDLTEAGAALLPALDELRRWAELYLPVGGHCVGPADPAGGC